MLQSTARLRPSELTAVGWPPFVGCPCDLVWRGIFSLQRKPPSLHVRFTNEPRPLLAHALWQVLGLYKPLVWEYSRLNMTHTVMSKRKLAQLVAGGHVSGWGCRLQRCLTCEVCVESH